MAINAEQAHSENFALRKNQGVNLNSGAKLAAVSLKYSYAIRATIVL